MLELDHLAAGYGAGDALRAVSLRLGPGELALVFGRNGSGRSTLLRALMGLATVRGGLRLDEHPLGALPAWEIARLGVGYAPDTRDVFPTLSTRDNLRVIAPRATWCTADALLTRFAPLLARAGVAAGRLSGGEQKLLAIARAALGASRLLLLDEPYEGLAEPMCAAVDALIADARAAGVMVVCVDRDHARLGAAATHWLLLGAGEPRYCGAPAPNEPALAEWATT